MTQRLLDDWLKAYVLYTYPTEPPEIFHLWSGISVIAGVLKRKSFISFSHFNLYPNNYIVLIGPPGSMKSSAMRIGRDLISAVPGAKFTVDSLTREKFILDLSQSYVDGQSAMTAYCSEFGSFFSSSGPEMAVFLTDIYECPSNWAHASKMGGTQNIQNVCVNLLACTTPESMEKSLPLTAIGLGLTSRIIFVNAELPRERDWRTRKTAEQMELERYLVSDLQLISTLAGEFNLNDKADQAFNSWNRAYKQNPYKDCKDDRLKPYFARKHTHLLKLCMVLSAAQRGDMMITENELNLAHELLEQVEEKMPKAFAGMGASPLASPLEKVLTLLEQSTEPVPYEVLLERMHRHMRREELDEILETMTLTRIAIKLVRPGETPQYLLRRE